MAMSDSYMEISRQIDTSEERTETEVEEGVATTGNLSADKVQKRNSEKQERQSRPDSLVTDKAFPYNLDGMVCKEGDMTHFVTDNLEYKIKLSSPVTRKDSGGFYVRHNSTPSSSHSGFGGSGSRSHTGDPMTAGGQQPQQSQTPRQDQVDRHVLSDIELEAQYLAASLDNLTENLCNLLHSISSITADNVEIHKNAVNKLTDSMDANIKSMYTIMAKTEEISKSMKPTEQLANRIREIKRLVDMLDSNV